MAGSDVSIRPAALAVALRQTIAVSDIRVEAFIGVHGHELDRRQSLVIGATLGVVPPDGDTIASTIDYNRVVELSRSLAEQGIGLIETFARRLGEELLAEPRVLQVEVVVVKPGALPNGTARATASLVRGSAIG
ncbi:dihydroneopterin aldolase [Novosphingobium piscinae]|uniref:Dihydroneopterin aldolase n=1 Tax=Novosphingobium piscinae TaxID=1507448 RepID=A0A7X1FWZ1_9SPHN|nr:dihydroneopterin aldolase [Novosphingobium piscinae]MBC2667882.1 dihydroneopterin aldolase [Novosphingobium piscinae]